MDTVMKKGGIIDLSDWLANLKDNLTRFLATLKVKGHLGRFYPCAKGVTNEGREISLGFSCFAAKIYYTLGLWDELSMNERAEWIAFIRSFQVDGNPTSDRVSINAFIDEPVVNYLADKEHSYRPLIARIVKPRHLTHLQRTIIAETKQSIATLAQIGEKTDRPYRGFPARPTAVRRYLKRFDWTQPWGAGAHASALSVFLKSQSPAFLKEEENNKLLAVCIHFLDEVADKESGGYFLGDLPEQGMLINGAMKVLTALDWLEVPVHYPERLIDTCLVQPPSSEGCYLVDYVYVLYRCSLQTNYKREEVKSCCYTILDMIKKHFNPEDGGFSYNVGLSQSSYYGVPITKQSAVSDIHGTCLLTWAVAMILEIMDNHIDDWKVIRP